MKNYNPIGNSINGIISLPDVVIEGTLTVNGDIIGNVNETIENIISNTATIGSARITNLTTNNLWNNSDIYSKNYNFYGNSLTNGGFNISTDINNNLSFFRITGTVGTSSSNSQVASLSSTGNLTIVGNGFFPSAIIPSGTVGSLFSNISTITSLSNTNQTSINLLNTNLSSSNARITNLTSSSTFSVNSLITNLTSSNIRGTYSTIVNMVSDNAQITSLTALSNSEFNGDIYFYQNNPSIFGNGSIGPLTIDPNFSSQSYVRIYDRLNVSGTLDVTGSLTAPANSNTIGNLFTFNNGVGIGTTNPLSTLHVNNDIGNNYLIISGPPNVQQAIEFKDTTYRWIVYKPANGTDLRFYTGSGDVITFNSRGNINQNNYVFNSIVVGNTYAYVNTNFGAFGDKIYYTFNAYNDPATNNWVVPNGGYGSHAFSLGFDGIKTWHGTTGLAPTTGGIIIDENGLYPAVSNGRDLGNSTTNRWRNIFAGSLNITGNSNTIGSIITTGGNVGIGAVPNTDFEVRGSVYPELRVAESDALYGSIIWDHIGDNLLLQTAFNAYPVEVQGSQLNINNSGIAIGTTSLDGTLTINGSTNSKGLTIDGPIIKFGPARVGGPGGTTSGQAYISHGAVGTGSTAGILNIFTKSGSTTYTGLSINAGSVGIGTTAPAYQLEVSTDSAAKPSTNTWTISSDIRLKTNITQANLDTCYDNVKNIPLKRYTWLDSVYTEEQVPDRSKLGWIAQDVETILPKSVEIKNQHGIEDCRSLNADQIIACLYGAVQKLIQKVEQLENSN